jgi:hypothetical protein
MCTKDGVIFDYMNNAGIGTVIARRRPDGAIATLTGKTDQLGSNRMDMAGISVREFRREGDAIAAARAAHVFWIAPELLESEGAIGPPENGLLWIVALTFSGQLDFYRVRVPWLPAVLDNAL